MSVYEEWGMECPKCGENGSLSVEVKVMARLTSDGTDPDGDHEWDDDSICICDTCGRHGKVSDFKPDNLTRKYETLITVAADTVEVLRRCDVYRLIETSVGVHGIETEEFGAWLIEERPDLEAEIRNSLKDVVG